VPTGVSLSWGAPSFPAGFLYGQTEYDEPTAQTASDDIFASSATAITTPHSCRRYVSWLVRRRPDSPPAVVGGARRLAAALLTSPACDAFVATRPGILGREQRLSSICQIPARSYEFASSGGRRVHRGGPDSVGRHGTYPLIALTTVISATARTSTGGGEHTRGAAVADRDGGRTTLSPSKTALSLGSSPPSSGGGATAFAGHTESVGRGESACNPLSRASRADPESQRQPGKFSLSLLALATT